MLKYKTKALIKIDRYLREFEKSTINFNAIIRERKECNEVYSHMVNPKC